LNNSDHACQEILKQVDLNDSRDIDFEEFYRLMQPALAGEFSRDQLWDAFRSFDQDNSGQISVQELGKVLSALGHSYNDAQVLKLITKADRNLDGQLNFEGI
jgi:Ca2+-binding EF-hand superfamily protein